MDDSTFTGANLQIIRVSNGSNQTGTITGSPDALQVVIEPASKPLNNNNEYDCNALVGGVTDLAGNALSPGFSARFRTAGGGQFFQDKTPPSVLGMVPADNTPDASPSSTYTIYFSEAIEPSTIVGSVVDGSCNLSGGNIPNVFLFELSSCNGGNGQPIDGTVSLNGDGTIATFTPDDPGDMEENNCYGLVVTNCVEDLSGNALPNKGTRNIGAYDGDSVTYNTYNVFFTGSADVTSPELVHVGPLVESTGVHEFEYPFFIFDEAIDPATVSSSSFTLTEFGNPSPIPVQLKSDPTLQVVEFRPVLSLDASTTHTLTSTGQAADPSGNLVTSPQTSRYSTGTADSTSPTIVSVTPDQGDDINDRCPYIDIHFDEPLSPFTVNSANFELVRVRNDTVKPTTLIFSDNGMHVRLIPDSSLNTGGGTRNDWEIRISADVADRNGNTLGAEDSRVFEVFTDTTVPTVSAVVPPSGGSTYRNGSILVFFSEPMDKSTLVAGNFTITGCTPIMFADPYGNYAVANCINQMGAGNRTITINRNVRDFYNTRNNQSCETGGGNRMNANVNSSFTVINGTDSTAPTVSNATDVTPQDGSTSVATSISPSVQFSEAIDPRTVMPSTFFLMDAQGRRIDAEISFSTDARTITLNPESNLASPGFYYIVGTTAIRDLSGGNEYDGAGGETVEIDGILRTCFSTDGTACP